MPLNYEEIEVKYTQQTPENNAGLGSDGELVQAVTSGPSSAGAGGGKGNVENIVIIKYVDSDADSFDFRSDAPAGVKYRPS